MSVALHHEIAGPTHGPVVLLAQLDAPTLVVSGADDPASAPGHQRLIADAIPGARLELVANAAHLASVQQPQIVNRLLAEHLHASDRGYIPGP